MTTEAAVGRPQVKFRCKWMLDYVKQHLAPSSGSGVPADHPLAAQRLDANIMGTKESSGRIIYLTFLSSQ